MPGIQETFWAIRQVFEALAAERPLVVVFDDIQWGESTFLDLLEYLADWIRGKTILIVCLARSELFDVRPGWTTGKPNATLISLHHLTELETDGLIRNFLGRVELARPTVERIAEVTEGNPLFVEETLRMLVDDGLLRHSEDGWVPVRRHLAHRDSSDDPRAADRPAGSLAGRQSARLSTALPSSAASSRGGRSQSSRRRTSRPG